MDQEKKEGSQQGTISLTNLDAALSLSMQKESGMDYQDVPRILQATASHFSKTVPSSSANDLIRNSNDETVLCKLEDVLKTHFHPLNLTTLPSVVIYLLLNYFLLNQENKEVEAAKKLYEDHIALLKEKNSELEDRIRERGTKQTTVCVSCEELQQKVEGLTSQCSKLKQSYDELCHINDQWALDYDALAKHITNATGFHSIATSSSTQSRESSAPKYMPDPSCVRCGIYESQLDDKQQEVDGLRAMIVGLREDIKEGKERLTQKQRELSSLENEYQIVRLQIQEIGDMQQTLHMKQDYRKMQRSLQHKTKLYQEAVCEKLELQKQVEKLRQTFLKFFPAPNPAPHPHNPSMVSSRPPQSGGFYSFPLHSCRHNLQSYPVDPAPPTPPGLLARGDLRGGFVEKDEHPIPAIRLEEHSSTAHTAVHYPHQYVGGNDLVNPQHNPRGNTVAAGMPPETRMSRSRSSDHVSNFNSNDTVSHSCSKVLTGSPSQNSSGVASSYTNNTTSIPSTLSSLGYVSEDHSYRVPPSLSPSPNLVHFYSSRPKGSFGNSIGSDETELSSGHSSMRPRMQKSRSQESADSSIQGQSSLRPTSLFLPNSGGSSQAQQLFLCPNCRKTFSCNSKNDAWFDHLKTCGV